LRLSIRVEAGMRMNTSGSAFFSNPIPSAINYFPGFVGNKFT
jgi:hypothetical protein